MSSDKKISPHTEKMAGSYLFDIKTGEGSSQALDMRTRIRSEAGMRALLYLGTLAETMDSEVARKLKDLTERLFIAYGGEGRKEAVEVLRQNFPKKVEIERGREIVTTTDIEKDKT